MTACGLQRQYSILGRGSAVHPSHGKNAGTHCVDVNQQHVRQPSTLQKVDRVELHLSGLIGTPSHPDMQKPRIIGLFFENRLQLQSEVQLLLFTVRTSV